MRDKTGDSIDRTLMTELRSLHITSLTAAQSGISSPSVTASTSTSYFLPNISVSPRSKA